MMFRYCLYLLPITSALIPADAPLAYTSLTDAVFAYAHSKGSPVVNKERQKDVDLFVQAEAFQSFFARWKSVSGQSFIPGTLNTKTSFIAGIKPFLAPAFKGVTFADIASAVAVATDKDVLKEVALCAFARALSEEGLAAEQYCVLGYVLYSISRSREKGMREVSHPIVGLKKFQSLPLAIRDFFPELRDCRGVYCPALGDLTPLESFLKDELFQAFVLQWRINRPPSFEINFFYQNKKCGYTDRMVRLLGPVLKTCKWQQCLKSFGSLSILCFSRLARRALFVAHGERDVEKAERYYLLSFVLQKCSDHYAVQIRDLRKSVSRGIKRPRK